MESDTNLLNTITPEKVNFREAIKQYISTVKTNVPHELDFILNNRDSFSNNDDNSATKRMKKISSQSARVRRPTGWSSLYDLIRRHHHYP